MVLFNTHRYRMNNEPPDLSHPDESARPMPWPRLTSQAEYGNPTAYVRVDHYLGAVPAMPRCRQPGPGVARAESDCASYARRTGATRQRWIFRGANLCAWEAGLSPPLRRLRNRDRPRPRSRPVRARRPRHARRSRSPTACSSRTPTVSRARPARIRWRATRSPRRRRIDRSGGVNALEVALANIQNAAGSDGDRDPGQRHLQLSTSVWLPGWRTSAGVMSLRLSQPLTIRAATGQRPVIRLVRPLRIPSPRPDGSAGVDALTVTLAGPAHHLGSRCRRLRRRRRRR